MLNKNITLFDSKYQLFREYLFSKNILVSKEIDTQDVFECLYTLAHIYNINIVDGANLLNKELLKFVQSQIPRFLKGTFYTGFPTSVRTMAPDKLLFDQLHHYYTTYGVQDATEPFEPINTTSIFEQFELQQQKKIFNESTCVKHFKVVSESEAKTLICSYVDDLCLSTRPLSSTAMNLVQLAHTCGHHSPNIASKDTLIRLLLTTHDAYYMKKLKLSYIPDVVEKLVLTQQHTYTPNKLNLTNKQRKFITLILNSVEYSDHQLKLCFEKRAWWKGLLHHIHYKPIREDIKLFVDAIRNYNHNLSVTAQFKKFIDKKDIIAAVETLYNHKGTSAVLHNLNYILSRCDNISDVDYVLSKVQECKPLLLMQLITCYYNYSKSLLNTKRTFSFTKNYTLKQHTESDSECLKRKSIVSTRVSSYAELVLKRYLRATLSGRLEKVYIDEAMSDIALPMQETTAQVGYGLLPRGTRFSIPNDKVIRTFVYWEKVNDIDLSAIGLTSEGKQIEFSWRTMYNQQSQAITFSGDQTCGYHGGSEYFDLNIDAIRKQYPTIRYIVLNANVFTGTPFDECFCKAGFMLRDKMCSGEIYEPKTVESAYNISGDSIYNSLFAVDIHAKEIIWLNLSMSSKERISGLSSMQGLVRYLDQTAVFNMKTFFELLAKDVVNDINEARVIISNDQTIRLKAGQEQITSNNTERILALMNQ